MTSLDWKEQTRLALVEAGLGASIVRIEAPSGTVWSLRLADTRGTFAAIGTMTMTSRATGEQRQQYTIDVYRSTHWNGTRYERRPASRRRAATIEHLIRSCRELAKERQRVPA